MTALQTKSVMLDVLNSSNTEKEGVLCTAVCCIFQKYLCSLPDVDSDPLLLFFQSVPLNAIMSNTTVHTDD